MKEIEIEPGKAQDTSVEKASLLSESQTDLDQDPTRDSIPHISEMFQNNDHTI